MSVLTDAIMEALDKIIPAQPFSFTDNLVYASGCGCTGDCGQSCHGGCEAGCTGDCGRSCSGSCS